MPVGYPTLNNINRPGGPRMPHKTASLFTQFPGAISFPYPHTEARVDAVISVTVTYFILPVP